MQLCNLSLKSVLKTEQKERKIKILNINCYRIIFFETILCETGLMVLLSTGSFLWPLYLSFFYFAYIKLNKVSHNGAHLTLDIMLLPLLTRNVCIYLLNVSFFLFLFTIPSTKQIHYENSLENQSVLRNWALFDERPKKNKIYL